MKMKFKSSARAAGHTVGAIVGAGTVMLIASNGHAQNLFVSDWSSGGIYEYTPGGGTPGTFASGLSAPYGLAFNNAGNLFVANFGTGEIYEYTPGGARSTIASGIQGNGLA